MSLVYLTRDRSMSYISDDLKRKEEQDHQANADKVRAMLIREGAEDLIPMILGGVEE